MMLYPTGEFTTAAYTLVIHQRDVYAAVFTTDDFTKKETWRNGGRIRSTTTTTTDLMLTLTTTLTLLRRPSLIEGPLFAELA